MSPEPGLYVHVPFCSALCPYCDFAVNVGGGGDRRSRFPGLLASEIALHPEPNRRFDTLYFGGGTPSAIVPEELAAIVDAFVTRGWLTTSAVLYLEVNPEDVSAATLSSWKAMGIHTLSLGIQSFDDDSLRFLGRRHSARQARAAVELARAAGLGALSVDLIYGLPGQTEAAWRGELETAVNLAPDHISCYQLTVHENTLFGRRRRKGRLAEAPADDQATLFRLTHRRLEDAGYEGYEVSNFAHSRSARSRHNAKYWDHVPYLGLGPSAHSFDGRVRSWNRRSVFDWSRAVERGELPRAGEEHLSEDELLLETLMLRLRTRDGLDLDRVRERFGVDLLGANGELVGMAVDEGLLVAEEKTLRPTLDGLAVADGLASRFRIQIPASPCPKTLTSR